MSEKLTLNDGAPEGNSTGEEFIMEEALTWEELPKLRVEVVKDLIKNQQLHTELCKMFSSTIEKDSKLKDMVIGISKTYEDIAHGIVAIDGLYKDKAGNAEGIDDQMLYIRVANNYNEKLEQIANTASLGYLDVLAVLQTKSDGISSDDIAKIQAATLTGQNEVSAVIAAAQEKVNTNG